jgi:hypothetical protein
MKQSIKNELKSYVRDSIKEKLNYGDVTHDISEMHQEMFNMDYYIIGYYQAERWLEDHGLTVFEAIREVNENEKLHFGETKIYDDAESLVNMLVYFYSMEIMYDMENEIWEMIDAND